MDDIKKECWECKHLQRSIHMKLEDDTLYCIWCKKGDMNNPNKCNTFERKDSKYEYRVCKTK